MQLVNLSPMTLLKPFKIAIIFYKMSESGNCSCGIGSGNIKMSISNVKFKNQWSAQSCHQHCLTSFKMCQCREQMFQGKDAVFDSYTFLIFLIGTATTITKFKIEDCSMN